MADSHFDFEINDMKLVKVNLRSVTWCSSVDFGAFLYSAISEVDLTNAQFVISNKIPISTGISGYAASAAKSMFLFVDSHG